MDSSAPDPVNFDAARTAQSSRPASIETARSEEAGEGTKTSFLTKLRTKISGIRLKKKREKKLPMRPTISAPTFLGRQSLDYGKLQNGLIPVEPARPQTAGGAAPFVEGLSDNPAYGHHTPPRKRKVKLDSIKRLPGEGPNEAIGATPVDRSGKPLLPAPPPK
ncbi:hypothetical protein BJ508DRAFT_328261 [Ascobolus immersus RN42]|uniref:Uncharacterized protein n=1 Tax=Ascobolus immersus RN42 TaxID=1160509 RepID=A0A3N4I602_ASCIM|nr:hypothetical protein BJ508DRAFT_328261 [Ascobolus immersus RN42]